MLDMALYLLLHSLYISLRVSGGGSFPKPLSAAEEKKYLALAENGDEAAQGVLIERNLRLVAHVIKKYYTAEDEQDDLISIGTIGLIKAVKSFRSDKNIRLATYACRCIENEVLMYFRSKRKRAGEVMLSDVLEAENGGAPLVLEDTLSEGDEDMLERLDREEAKKLLGWRVEKVLDEREKLVIKLRYGLCGSEPLAQREVACICGISRSYVSRIEKRALEKLRATF